MNSSRDETFESGLVAALQPIRGFVLANAIHQFFESGLYETILEVGPISTSQLAEQENLDTARLEAFLQFLTVEQLLLRTEEGFEVADAARDLVPYLPWYRMLIGGYGQTFLTLSQHLGQGSDPADRNLAMVGEGSCGISHFDAIPLTKRLIDRMPQRPERVVDLGCGNGRYLVELCEVIPGIQALGIEPSQESTDAGNQLISQAGLADRAEVIRGDASIVLSNDVQFEPQCFILGFVLQEILGQVGRQGLLDFLRNLFDRYPKAYLVVIEVDNQHDDVEQMQTGLAHAYYNSYYLLHPFTQQRLETRPFWQELFHECGGLVVAEDTTDTEVDSTGLELGFLVSRRSGI